MCTSWKILWLVLSWTSITTHCVAVARAGLYKLCLTIFCMQIISSTWYTQKQLQHAYDRGNYSHWSALSKSLRSLRAVSLDRAEFCGVGAERQAYPCLDDKEEALWLQSSFFWSSFLCNVCIKWYQALITKIWNRHFFPQAWPNLPCSFSLPVCFPQQRLCTEQQLLCLLNIQTECTRTLTPTPKGMHTSTSCMEGNALHKSCSEVFHIEVSSLPSKSDATSADSSAL